MHIVKFYKVLGKMNSYTYKTNKLCASNDCTVRIKAGKYCIEHKIVAMVENKKRYRQRLAL